MKIFQTKVVEELKTHILCAVTFFFENRAVYEIMWNNIVEWCRSQVTIWRTRIACWIPKATNTHTGCVIPLLFQLYNSCTNTPQSYVTRTLLVLLSM